MDSESSATSDAESGEERAHADALFTLAYDQLRRLASALRRREATATLQTTALVNEAWLKLSDSPGLKTVDEAHFKRIAVRAMRQVLVDAARRRHAAKREGSLVTFEDDVATTAERAEWLLALDGALTRLAAISPRQAQMIEARFFGGLDVLETAKLMGISEATVMRDWRLARAWLASELADGLSDL